MNRHVYICMCNICYMSVPDRFHKVGYTVLQKGGFQVCPLPRLRAPPALPGAASRDAEAGREPHHLGQGVHQGRHRVGAIASYLRVYTHTYIQYMDVYKQASKQASMHACIHTYIHTRTHIHLSIHLFTCLCICNPIDICIYVHK